MKSRPDIWTAANAGRFESASLVGRYHLRPQYPPAIFTKLAELCGPPPRRVLDVGTGLGEIARGMAPFMEEVVAIDASPNMIERARTMPGIANDRITWQAIPAEQFDEHDFFALVTAGSALHWMDWDIVLPLFSRLLRPGGFLADAHRTESNSPWKTDLETLLAGVPSYTTHEAFDLLADLTQRGMFEPVGRFVSDPVPMHQSVADYVESWHSKSGLSRDVLSEAESEAFDTALRELLAPYALNEVLTFDVVGTIDWGVPLAPAPQ